MRLLVVELSRKPGILEKEDVICCVVDPRREMTVVIDIDDISLLGSIGSEICIAGYARLLVRRNTVLLDTARHS